MTDHSVSDMLADLTGHKIPGGCDLCPDPYQQMMHDSPGVFLLTVFHDDGCPMISDKARA